MTSRSPTTGVVRRPQRVLDHELKNHRPLNLAHSADPLGCLEQQLVEAGHPLGDRFDVVPLKQHVVELGLAGGGLRGVVQLTQASSSASTWAVTSPMR
jgi:hypothetical protein